MKNVLLITDMDGTLVPNLGLTVSNKNLEAAKEFLKLGGKLSVATGRNCHTAKPIYQSIGANIPAILHSGSCIYDFKREEILYEALLPASAKDLLRHTLKIYPHCGVMVFDTQKEYVINYDEDLKEYYKKYHLRSEKAGLDKINKMIKGFISCNEEEQEEIYGFLCKNANGDLSITRSAPNYIEILPESTSKATALLKLIELYDLDLRNVVAIGDYYNDFEMLKIVGMPVAVITAPQNLKDVSKYVVNDCESSIVDVVKIIKDNFYNKK